MVGNRVASDPKFAARTEPPLEAEVESRTSEYARSKGCLALKLNVIGRRGWPDRLYLYKGRVLFIEFKKQGEKPRKLQEYVHNQIRSHGFVVALVDNVKQGFATIDGFTNGYQ